MEKIPLHLLILEDRPDDTELAVRELEREGFILKWSRVETEKAFREALEKKTDLILADYTLPSFDGMTALKIKQEITPTIPLIILSGTINEEMAVGCMKAGAADYILKDRLFRLGPVVKRVFEEAETYRARKQAEEELHQSFERLQKILDGIIQAMALIVEMRDPYTAGHEQRVTKLACTIAKAMGLSEEQIEGIRVSGTMHDIGKMYVPAEILSKPGQISEDEFAMIRTHPNVGHDILKTIEFPWPVAQIVFQHHERMDGSGYPQGLSGKEIMLEARILAVADVVEAMSSHRPYRPALGIGKALKEISMNRGVLYDPKVVDACLKLFTEKEFNFE